MKMCYLYKSFAHYSPCRVPQLACHNPTHAVSRRFCSMSWQQYVDDHLMCALKGGGQLTSGAIVGLDGGIWAQSANFPPATTDQLKFLVGGFAGEEGLATLQATSPVLGDIKFFIIASETGVVIRGKCNNGGFCVKRTNQSLVIGIFHNPVVASDADAVVEALADYLIGQNF